MSLRANTDQELRFTAPLFQTDLMLRWRKCRIWEMFSKDFYHLSPAVPRKWELGKNKKGETILVRFFYKLIWNYGHHQNITAHLDSPRLESLSSYQSRMQCVETKILSKSSVECWTAQFTWNLEKKKKILHTNHMEIPDLLFRLGMACAFASVPYQYWTLY